MALDLNDFSADVQRTLTAYGAADADSGARRAHRDFTLRLHDGGRRPPAREDREAALNALLAPGATASHGAGNRAIPEEPDPVRTCFERDLDRIKHHVSFRRLAGKCQVFIAPEDVHLRTRMTHSLEVAQVAVGIAAAVGANTALTEAAALGHDCGHGPMGHASEEAFSPYLPDGYDHAPYGARMLADANLCVETVDAIANHSWRRPAPATLEGEIVSFADRIAYVCHDFDDAVRAGIVTADHLPEQVADVLGTRQSAQLRTLITAVIDTAHATGVIGLQDPVAATLDVFRAFNYEHIYLRPASRAQGEKAIVLLRELVDFFIDHPARVATTGGPVPFPGSPEAAAAAVHHVAQLTDASVLDLGVRLLGWDRTALPRGA